MKERRPSGCLILSLVSGGLLIGLAAAVFLPVMPCPACDDWCEMVRTAAAASGFNRAELREALRSAPCHECGMARRIRLIDFLIDQRKSTGAG